jgi:hypothetical protein
MQERQLLSRCIFPAKMEKRIKITLKTIWVLLEAAPNLLLVVDQAKL